MKKIGRFYLPQSDRIFTKHCNGKENTLYGHDFQLDYITKIIEESKPGNIVDAGANIGLFATAFSKHFDNVFAFEPVPMNKVCLEKNVIGYDNIKLFEYALGNKTDTVEMIGRLNNPGTFRILPNPRVRKGNAIYENIYVKTLDSFKLDNVSCIKIDCEGYEADILEGATKTIKKYKPLLCIEFMPINKGGDQQTHDRVNYFLSKNGYKKVWEEFSDAIFSC